MPASAPLPTIEIAPRRTQDGGSGILGDHQPAQRLAAAEVEAGKSPSSQNGMP